MLYMHTECSNYIQYNHVICITWTHVQYWLILVWNVAHCSVQVRHLDCKGPTWWLLIRRRKRLLQSADNRFSTKWRHLRQYTSLLLAALDPWSHFLFSRFSRNQIITCWLSGVRIVNDQKTALRHLYASVISSLSKRLFGSRHLYNKIIRSHAEEQYLHCRKLCNLWAVFYSSSLPQVCRVLQKTGGIKTHNVLVLKKQFGSPLSPRSPWSTFAWCKAAPTTSGGGVPAPGPAAMRNAKITWRSHGTWKEYAENAKGVPYVP